jgi:hypothetical protein
MDNVPQVSLIPQLKRPFLVGTVVLCKGRTDAEESYFALVEHDSFSTLGSEAPLILYSTDVNLPWGCDIRREDEVQALGHISDLQFCNILSAFVACRDASRYQREVIEDIVCFAETRRDPEAVLSPGFPLKDVHDRYLHVFHQKRSPVFTD